MVSSSSAQPCGWSDRVGAISYDMQPAKDRLDCLQRYQVGVHTPVQAHVPCLTKLRWPTHLPAWHSSQRHGRQGQEELDESS